MTTRRPNETPGIRHREQTIAKNPETYAHVKLSPFVDFHFQKQAPETLHIRYFVPN